MSTEVEVAGRTQVEQPTHTNVVEVPAISQLDPINDAIEPIAHADLTKHIKNAAAVYRASAFKVADLQARIREDTLISANDAAVLASAIEDADRILAPDEA